MLVRAVVRADFRKIALTEETDGGHVRLQADRML